PPGEEAVVVGGDVAADVDEAAREEALDQRALLGELADRLLAQRRVDVDRGAGDVEVAGEDEVLARRLEDAGPGRELAEEAELGGEVLAAVRDVDRGEDERPDLGDDDALLLVER